MKPYFTMMFKNKTQNDNEIINKRKLKHYKYFINLDLDNQHYFSNTMVLKTKMNIDKIRTNAHDLHSEASHWTNPKTPWDERICKICDAKVVDDE